MSRLENFRYLYPQIATDPIIAIAKHDNLYWIIITAKGAGDVLSSKSGSETEEVALQKCAEFMAIQVWSQAKDNGLTLSK
jgi:hypothetical protein